MFDLIDNIETILPVYLLVFVRLTTMMIIMPIFSHALINNRFRSLIAFSFALIIGSSLSNSTDLNINSIWEFALLVVTESLLGFILGFGTKIVFEAFSVALIIIFKFAEIVFILIFFLRIQDFGLYGPQPPNPVTDQFYFTTYLIIWPTPPTHPF